MEGYEQGAGVGRMGEKVQGIRNIIGRYKIDRGFKYSIGNGEAKELTCTTHGHEPRERAAGGKGVLSRGEQTGKNWDNCNSIINKIYFKNKNPKQTTRTGTESQKWGSHEGLPWGKRSGENGGKGTGNKKHEW